VHTFKLSNDPKFAAKLKDIVGLYIDPPAHAVVLSVDEKSQMRLWCVSIERLFRPRSTARTARIHAEA
jgi:hypothetical protein